MAEKAKEWIRPAPALWSLACCVALCACGEAPPPQGAVVRDSAGVTIVENAAAGRSANEAWVLSPEPLLRIGSRDGSDPAAQFTHIRGLTRLGDGRIVVLDGQTVQVRWFAPDGRHLVTRGGRGGGPGEFTAASELLRLPGDTVLVKNVPRVKHVLFSPAGDFLREEPLDLDRYRELGRWMECLTLTLPDRSMLGCVPEEGRPRPPEAPGHFRSWGRFVLVPWSLTAAYPLGLYGGIEQWGVDMGNGRTAFEIHPFHSFTRVAAGGSPLRVAIAVNPAYSVEVWTTDGRLEHIIRRTIEQRPTAAERDHARQYLTENARDPAMMNRMLAEMREPDVIPAVVALDFGPDGDLWVTRRSILARHEAVADLFDARGRLLGELQLPDNFHIREIGADYVLGIRIDELDVQYVELYSLRRTPETLSATDMPQRWLP